MLIYRKSFNFSYCVLNCLFLSILLGSSFVDGRLISTLFGTPTHCNVNNVRYACTLSLACWIIGGNSESGCGQPSWFVSCCIVNKSNHASSSTPPIIITTKQKKIPETAILRKRVDDFPTYIYENTDEECGISREHKFIQKRIIGGQEARFGQFPWQAHIRISAYQCGGVLVSSRYVATAAHCIIRAPLHDILVYLGELDTLDTGVVPELVPAEKYRVMKKIIHPLFEYRLSQPDRYDLALLKLNTGRAKVRHGLHITPICLPDMIPEFNTANEIFDNNDVNALLAGKMAVVAGWGKILPSIDQSGTNLLRSATVPILDAEECVAWHNSKQIKVELHSEMICAGHADGNQDACLGDSGGPLIIKMNGRWTLVGITSAGFGCGEPKQPGIYHSVSITASWIRHMINM
ncbi:prostasin [Chrysoperla carnea]|uniref:prostasin n=1 Tax=Chrysoperla carnea TaxID=189513 RepID=UPI001D0644AF|nr:prostasin [Chrysoperla carnea]